MTSQWPPPLPAGSDPAPGTPFPDPPLPAAAAGWPATMGDALLDARGPRPSYDVRRDLPLALAVVGALLMAGVAAGFIWHAVSPQPRVSRGPGTSLSLPASTDKNYFGADATFLAITAAAGLVTGIAVWNAGRRRGPAMPVALTVGAVLAAVVARAVGEAQVTDETLAAACGLDPGLESICFVYDGHLRLRVVGLVLTWAIIALTSFLTLTVVADRQKPVAAQLWPPPPP